jgi:thiol-disulfide isomerase/thioredoxin
MARTASNMLALGTVAPDFKLLDTVSGGKVSLQEIASGRPFVVMFICNHCPFVKHVNEQLVSLAKDYSGKGISFIAISSNDAIAYQEDGPEQMKLQAQDLGYPFPYLYDESQEVAKAYDAACTPDFYLFNAAKALVYRGQLDDSRPSNNLPVTGNDLRAALNALLEGHPLTRPQQPSIGCNIKWKK